MKKVNKTKISVSIDADTVKEIDEWSKKMHLSRSSFLSLALGQYLFIGLPSLIELSKRLMKPEGDEALAPGQTNQ